MYHFKMSSLLTFNNNYESDSFGKAIVFIPGGPCISGNYWDIFINQSQFASNSDIKVYRLVLPNHEGLYTEGVSLSFEQTCGMILSELSRLSSYSEVYLCAHSYGGWVALKILDILKDKINLKKIFLVCTPVKLNFSEQFQNSRKQINSKIVISDDISFAKYLGEISDLYFSKGSDWGRKVFNVGYWQFNQNMGLTDEAELKSILNQKINLDTVLVNTDNDLLLDSTDPRKDFSSFRSAKLEIVASGGHFPMLEQSEKFSEAILSHIK